MEFTIEINGVPVKVSKGETILSALERNGISVPTLCSMKDFAPTGACRMCVVEVEGRENLIPSCSFKVEEWMKIKTHSPKVVKTRKAIVELLLADHPDDCLYCERNGNCELQDLAEDLHIRERKITGRKSHFPTDKTSISILKEPKKCILCNRCIRVCNEVVGVSTFERCFRGINSSVDTALKISLGISNCIYCGQCTLVCPTGALTEQINFSEISQFIHGKNKIVIALFSPTIPITLAEEFNQPSDIDLNGIMIAILRKIGFNKVFDTSLGADLVVMEETEDLIRRMKSGTNLPVFTSCCPSWVKYARQFYPELLPKLTTSKSPQQMMGSIIKTHFSKMEGVDPQDIHIVSIMPCTAKKYEASLPEMENQGIKEIDTVITTRELIRLINMFGINVNAIEPELPDSFLSGKGSAGKLVGVTGGAAEAAIRTIYWKLTGKELGISELSDLRGFGGIKETFINMNGFQFGAAVVNGMANARILMDEIMNGRDDLHFVEVMACPGGCINGGGQPISKNKNSLQVRKDTIYGIDQNETIRCAHLNPLVSKLYNDFLGSPMETQVLKDLHIHYNPLQVLK